MGSDNDNMLCTLKFISAADENVCRLCLCSVPIEAVCLEDNVTIERPYFEETLTYLDMLSELGVLPDQYLPKKLCDTCVDMVTSTYLFPKLYDYTTQIYTKVLERLSNSLDQMNTIGANTKTAYLLIQDSKDIIITSRKNHSSQTKADVLVNIKRTIQCKKNVIKKKKPETHKSYNACPQCPKVFGTPVQLTDHTERVHDPKKLKCSQCDKMFSTEKVLKCHEKYHHTSAICKLCFTQFPSKKSLRSHLDRHELFKCSRCEKVLSNKNTFKTHVSMCGNLEEKTPQFFCDICGKGYVRKNGIRSHLKTDHGFGEVLTCKWCGKKFDAVSKLRNHSVKHTRERNFHCEHCGNKFVTQAALIYHVRLHTGERPFQCDLCDESFLSASRRMEHKRSKHFGPTKQCPVCPMKFVTSNQLKKHVKRHYNPHSKLYCPDTDESQQLAINTIMVL